MNGIEWPSPWVAIEPERQQFYQAELQREVQPGHVLFGIEAQAVAQRLDNDDVLFHLFHHLPNHQCAWAVVHLTYATSEAGPQWPHTQLFDTFEAWQTEALSA